MSTFMHNFQNLCINFTTSNSRYSFWFVNLGKKSFERRSRLSCNEWTSESRFWLTEEFADSLKLNFFNKETSIKLCIAKVNEFSPQGKFPSIKLFHNWKSPAHKNQKNFLNNFSSHIKRVSFINKTTPLTYKFHRLMEKPFTMCEKQKINKK